METIDRITKGGEFLIKNCKAENVFIPEDFDEEQRMIEATCKEFIEKEIVPNLDRIDNQEEGLNVELLNKAGELGILGISIPEQYGGFGKNFVTGMLSTEVIGGGNSFAVTLAAHTGIGTLPILYYGNEEQKAKYIPKLASGEWKAAYCLTEPDSGSDANSGKTKATLSEDGKYYLLNGQKMWITNAGFADVFTVFAKIDDDKNLSAFIVEKSFGGITLNPEEKKMGIKGSSTRQVFFNNCKVPVENLLGEREGGFKIALNILNVGRIKLAGAALGGAKRVIDNAVKYAKERKQFGTEIANFGAIQYKLAEQAIRTFAAESAIYRCSQNIDDAIHALMESGMNKEKATIEGIKQFAAEAAILKVHGSEVLDYVVDEGVQIYGGMGYSAEAPMERAYRDSRINRIFEGTNEINRMLIVDMLLKKALKGELDLMTPAQNVAKELMSIPDFSTPDLSNPLAQIEKSILNFKKACLLVAGAAVQKLQMELANEQEILMNIADMIIETYVAESAYLRTKKLLDTNKITADAQQLSLTNVYVYDCSFKLYKYGYDALVSFTSEGDEQKMMLMGLKRFTKPFNLNIKNLRRNIAKVLIDKDGYCF
jgi:alkylation response protein AidB-like acyl-CoA dehydrogenase